MLRLWGSLIFPPSGAAASGQGKITSQPHFGELVSHNCMILRQFKNSHWHDSIIQFSKLSVVLTFVLHIRCWPVLIWLPVRPLHFPLNLQSVIPMFLHIFHRPYHRAFACAIFSPQDIFASFGSTPSSSSIQPTPAHLLWSSFSLKLAPSWPCRYLQNYFPTSVSTSHLHVLGHLFTLRLCICIRLPHYMLPCMHNVFFISVLHDPERCLGCRVPGFNSRELSRPQPRKLITLATTSSGVLLDSQSNQCQLQTLPRQLRMTGFSRAETLKEPLVQARSQCWGQGSLGSGLNVSGDEKLTS